MTTGIPRIDSSVDAINAIDRAITLLSGVAHWMGVMDGRTSKELSAISRAAGELVLVRCQIEYRSMEAS